MPRLLTALTVLAALAATAAARPQTDGTVDPIEATLPAKGSKPAVDATPRPRDNARSLPGDSCFAPHPLGCGDVSRAFTESATTTGSDPIFPCRAISPSHGAGTVWFSYTATSTSALITTGYTGGPRLPNNLAPDTILQVFAPGANCANPGAPIACDDDNGPGFLSRIALNNLVVGETYLIELAAWNTDYISDDYTITIAGNCSPVTNDGCANAAPLACNSETQIDLAAATDSANDPLTCAGPARNTRWYAITPTTARLRLVAFSDANTAAVLELYSGNCGALNSVACAYPPSTNTTTVIETPVVPGQTYLLLVGQHPDAGETAGLLTLNAECIEVAPNDECSGALPLACGQTVVAPLTQATGNGSDPFNTCQSTDHANSVWYSFVATTPRARVTTGSLERGSPATGVVSILDGVCPIANIIDCGLLNDPSFFSAAEVGGLVIGRTYYVLVGARNSLPPTQRGAVFDITVTLECIGTPPENDTCATAQLIECGADLIVPVSTGTTDPADPAIDCADEALYAAVWYRFVAPDSGSVAIATFDPETGLDPEGDGDSVLTLFANTCGKLTEIACNDDEEITEDTLYSDIRYAGLTPGETYYLAVGAYGQSVLRFGSIADFRLTFACGADNDNCQTPQTVTCGDTFLADTRAATVVPGEPQPCVSEDAGSLWYAFVATSRSVVISTTLPQDNPLADSVLTLFASTDCDELSLLECNDDTDLSEFSLSSYLTYDDLKVGATYLLRVSAYDQESADAFQVTLQCGYQGDDCAQPIRFLDCNVDITVNTGLASTDESDPVIECIGQISDGIADRGFEPSPGAGSIWFSFVASSNQATITTNSPDRGGETDPVLVAYTGSCGELVPIACADDTSFSRFPTLFLTNLVPGDEYLIELASANNNALGLVNVSYNCPVITDGCFNASQLNCGVSTVIDTATLTTSPEEDPELTLCIGEGQTITATGWATIFPADFGSTITFRATALDKGVQPVLAFVRGECSFGTSYEIVECSSAITEDGNVSITVSGLKPFESYFLIVANASQTQGSILVTSDCYCPQLIPCNPAFTSENEPCEGGLNDTCETAQPISGAEIVCGTSRPRGTLPFFLPRGDIGGSGEEIPLDLDFYSLSLDRNLNARIFFVPSGPAFFGISCGCSGIGQTQFIEGCEFDSDTSVQGFFPAGQYVFTAAHVVPFFTDCTFANYILAVIPVPACAGDANADGIVSFLDITTVLANFGNVYSSKENPDVGFGDADSSGDVAFLDITTVLANFGTTCEVNNVFECDFGGSRITTQVQELLRATPTKRSSGHVKPAASADSPAAIRRAAKQR